MGTQRNLIIMACLSIVLSIGIMSLSPQKQTSGNPQRVFPDLMQSLDRVSRIEIKRHEFSFDIVKQNGAWIVPSLYAYPADMGQIKGVLFGIAELLTKEQKTDNPALYHRIALDDVNTKDSEATQITLFDKSEKTLADILLGKSTPTKLQKALSETFIRKPQDSQSWLAISSLPSVNETIDWINTKIIQLPESHLQRVVFKKAKTEDLIIERKSPTDSQFIIKNLKAKKAKVDTYMLNSVADSLSNLSLQSVIPSNAIKNATLKSQVSLSTFDGSNILITHYLKSKQHFATIHFKASDSKNQPQKNATMITIASNKWAYEIPSYLAEDLDKSLDDFLIKE